MDTAEAAGAHEANADRGGCRERPAHRRSADDALHRAGREVARPELAGARREALELRGREADHDAALEHADCGRYGAGDADRVLARETDLDPCGRREPVRDERRLERDDRALFLERFGDLVGDSDQVLHAGSLVASPFPSRRRPQSARNHRPTSPRGTPGVPEVTLSRTAARIRDGFVPRS